MRATTVFRLLILLVPMLSLALPSACHQPTMPAGAGSQGTTVKRAARLLVEP